MTKKLRQEKEGVSGRCTFQVAAVACAVIALSLLAVACLFPTKLRDVSAPPNPTKLESELFLGSSAGEPRKAPRNAETKELEMLVEVAMGDYAAQNHQRRLRARTRSGGMGGAPP